MQEKQNYKLSRASAAAVLAFSTVPFAFTTAETEAATVFKDVKVGSYYYGAVYELVGKNIVNGFGDGTFRPDAKVTRGQAAKMLALSLGLDVNNATTNRFSDVKSSNIYYKYIAALVNEGIINGMPDGTFRPDEPVLRGAMAKMVALGYKFTLAEQLTHSFKDVAKNNIFSYHIQTLVNLDITNGTTAVTFEPNKVVTRGQLAAFISRANKVEVTKPVYKVDNIVGNTIYINSIGYTIGSNVNKYIKVANRSALIGAYIEGDFSNRTLNSVTKLTLNAAGTQNNVYTFDGGNSTFAGQLYLNGSYLKLQNWTLTGTTYVSENIRRSLAEFLTPANIQIASLTSTASVIDWTKPTTPDDGNLNNQPGSGDLNSGSPSQTAYTAKLARVLKYIDFTNTDVRNLVIEQTNSYIAAQKKFPRVTIRRDVQFVEINANMKELYLEGDESLTIYGEHDVETAFKNSFYSVYFNSDSTINTLIVDNANGWIDLGKFVWIDKVIIPPKTTPNDIFDDYRNDNDQIGEIEDNTGEDVDREPIENGVVPDVTSPVIKMITTISDSNAVTFTAEVNEEGLFKYLILPKGAAVPTVKEIVNPSGGTLYGTVNVDATTKIEEGKYVLTKTQAGLEELKEYVLYGVQIDSAGNYSRSYAVDFATKDGTPPKFESKTIAAMYGGKRIKFDFKPSEEGTYYFFLRRSSSVDPSVTVEEIIEIGSRTPIGNTALTSGIVTQEMVANGFSTILYKDENNNDIRPEDYYVLYAALVDKSGNKIRLLEIIKAPVKTLELDNVMPFVTGPKDSTGAIRTQYLEPKDATTTTQFYLYFSEKVEKARAEDVMNYELSGTGIINVPGQARIKPSSVVYEESKNRVLITIPSSTGFVNGDTLRVTVLPQVIDLAENPFESLATVTNGTQPRNYAEYRHSDITQPDILNLKAITNTEKTSSEIEYTPTKAGFIYYMIMPSDTDVRDIKSREFIEEFEGRPTGKFDKLDGTKLYLEGTINNLPSRLSAEFEQLTNNQYKSQKFTYEINRFRSDINPFESYSLFMVLQDRSGNLSKIESTPIIADIKAPFIDPYSIEIKQGTALTQANVELNVTSDENGVFYYKVFEKYVKDNTGKYILNPAIHNGQTVMATLPDTTKQSGLNDLEREAKFKAYNNVTAGTLDLQQGTQTFKISNLEANKEYVIYTAARDINNNFTVHHVNANSTLNDPNQPNGTTMKSEIYTNYSRPEVTGQLMKKNLDDTFTITFNESILRTQPNKATGDLKESSTITSNTDLNSLLTLFVRDTTGLNNVTNDFEIVSYLESSTTTSILNPDQNTQLIIKPKMQGSSYLQNTINVVMAPNYNPSITTNVGLQDSDVNLNFVKRFDISDIEKVKYKFRTLSGGFNKLELSVNNTSAEITFSLNSSDTLEASEIVTYYYMIVNGIDSQNNELPLTAYTIDSIISSIDQINGNTLVSTGKGRSTTDVEEGRGKFIATNSREFFQTDVVFVVVEDKYGNRALIRNKMSLIPR